MACPPMSDRNMKKGGNKRLSCSEALSGTGRIILTTLCKTKNTVGNLTYEQQSQTHQTVSRLCANAQKTDGRQSQTAG